MEPISVTKNYESKDQSELLKIVEEEISSTEEGVVTHKISHKTAKDENGDKYDVFKLSLTRDYTK